VSLKDNLQPGHLLWKMLLAGRAYLCVYSVRRVVLGEAVEPSDMWGPLQLGRGQKTKAMLKQGTFQTQTSLT
jgi:hypothetical protein